MTEHPIGTREEWLAARVELLQAEKELTRRSDELARQRQQIPWVRIEKDYRFDTDEGSASPADLFRGRSQQQPVNGLEAGAGSWRRGSCRRGRGNDGNRRRGIHA